jgi:hypothetical protein
MIVERGERSRLREVALNRSAKLTRSAIIPARSLRPGQKVSPNFLSVLPQEGHAMVTD